MINTKAVVIGGGTGAPTSIRTLLDMGCNTNAIVSMVDDGGSTGILRELGGVIPPGDIRKCIGAMSADPDGIFARLFRHRFSYLDNHSLGNLFLIACAEENHSFPDAISVCERLIDARGHVYPSTLQDVVLCGTTIEGEELTGQAVIGDAPNCMQEVHLQGEVIQAYPAALRAIEEADLIVLGPGSLFTSIIPNLIVPGITEAIKKAHSREDNPAKVLFVCSLADMQGETWEMNCVDYVDALLRHGMEGLLDVVMLHRGRRKMIPITPDLELKDCNTARFKTRGKRSGSIRYVAATEAMVQEIEERGIQVMVKNFVDEHQMTWHNREALEQGFREVLA